MSYPVPGSGSSPNRFRSWSSEMIDACSSTSTRSAIISCALRQNRIGTPGVTAAAAPRNLRTRSSLSSGM